MTLECQRVGFKDGGERPCAKECGPHVEAGKGKRTVLVILGRYNEISHAGGAQKP